MSDKTKIEWTEATWNPVTGCTKVSQGCDHCYAETLAHRFAGTPAYPRGFEVTLRPERLDQPLRWRRPRMIFVNSMSDLFHASVQDRYIVQVFAVMALAGGHTFQLLTKRPGRMRSLLSSPGFKWQVWHHMLAVTHDRGMAMPAPHTDHLTWPLPNVWTGVSVETQRWADTRIPPLLATPAALRFLSCEPLLDHVDLDQPRCSVHGRRDLFTDPRGIQRCGPCAGDGGSGELSHGHWLDPLDGGIDWVIAGGESGPGARRMDPVWATTLAEECTAAGVAFFMKQAGNVLAREWGVPGKGDDPGRWPIRLPRQMPRPTAHDQRRPAQRVPAVHPQAMK